MVKSDNKTKVKTTYTQSNMGILLLKEAFQRDLALFASLLEKKVPILGQPLIPAGSTFTVVKYPEGNQELFVNVPGSKS